MVADSNLTFLPLASEHIPLLRGWLKHPHVAEFWQESEDEAEFRDKYLNKLQQRGVQPYLMIVDGIPIGYIQAYDATIIGGGWWPDALPGTWGIDQFIGEPEWMGKGMGTRIVRRFVQRLFQNAEVRHVITDPEPGNARAIRCYEKAGFVTVGQVTTPGGEAVLMLAERKTPDTDVGDEI